MSIQETYTFKKGDLIGTEAAEHDKEFLDSCFVDFGLLSVIKKCNKPQRIILGRTGSGKSALVLKLKEDEKNSLIFEPEKMLFDNVINSRIINELLDANINLLPFFKLLWRHVFFIDFAINYLTWKEEEKNNQGFIQKILSQLPNGENEIEKSYKKAVDEYLEKYIKGKNFNLWISTQDRITEFVDKYQLSLEAKISNIKGNLAKNSDMKINEKEKIQNIVSLEVSKDLNNILELTKKVLKNNEQKKYYIVVDKLDENWVSEKIRYILIQALIETLVDYQENNFKIIIVLRQDLLQKVYMENKSNIQHEKYNAFHLNVNWSFEMLEQMFDKRIQLLTNNKIKQSKLLFPEIKKGKKTDHPLQYIFDRTFLRPRDVISFMNFIIDTLVSKRQKKITLSLVKEA
jgi:hypothetical protein